MSEQDQASQKIINEVPGIAHTPQTHEGEVLAGQVIRIPEGEFKGDPTKVPGHPSNPFTNMDVSSLFPKSTTEEPVQVTTNEAARQPDMITGIPPEVQDTQRQ